MTTQLPPANGDVIYKNVSFDELEIKWKASPAQSKNDFSALSAWLLNNTEEIPVGKSKVSWDNYSLIGPVGISVEGSSIKLPAGYIYRLYSNLGIYKPADEEKNVFYTVDSQWVSTFSGVDTKIGSPGRDTCEGTGSLEVRNRTSLPAFAYVEAAEDTTVSLEIEFSDQPLKLAKGTQIHIEVLGAFEVSGKPKLLKSAATGSATKEPEKPARFRPFQR